MACAIKYYLIIHIYYLIAYSHGMSNEFILGEDRPYPELPITVSHALWEQAMNPTPVIKPPVLKSPVTIVVPVYVPPEDNDDDDYIVNEPENAIVPEQAVEVTAAPVIDQVVQDPIVANDTVAAEVTPAPIVQEDEVATTPAEPVTGSLVRFPCSCIEGQCGCCTGAFLQRFKTKACGNITFIPEDFIFDVKLSLNDNTVVRRRVSASDPPPICFNPRRAPFVTVCAEISNIRIRNRNAFACLDINADIGGFPVYSASFRCFGLGASGVQTGLKPKPASSGPAPVSLFNSNNDDDDDGGILGDVVGGGGLFGGGSDDDDDGGPLDAIGDAVGDFFGGRNMD